MFRMKVSVIVPVYNAEKYLNECIASIAMQTMKDIEIIVINDGSTDNSLNILDDLSLKYKGKLKVISQQNAGAGAARNVGLELANGEFIKFVDADDYLELNILERMYDIAKENKVSLVRGNLWTKIGPFKNEDRGWNDVVKSGVIDVFNNKDYIVKETPMFGNKLISRDLIGNIRFPERTKWEDLAIMPVLMASSERIFHMEEPVYNYRVNLNTTVKDFIYKIPNILDVIKCLDNVIDLMGKKGIKEEFQKQIESIYILHTLFRVENVMTWVNFPFSKKQVVISSLLSILDVKYPNWWENDIINYYRHCNFVFDYNMKRLVKYIDDKYRLVDIDKAKINIRKCFK